jgi:hypothetical protein
MTVKRFSLMTVLIVAITGGIPAIAGLFALLYDRLFFGLAMLLLAVVAWWAAVLVVLRVRARRGAIMRVRR